jgi:hypothetical protein
VKLHIMIPALVALMSAPGVSFAQVPPDIAAGIRKIGPIVDTPGTAKLYAPLFAQPERVNDFGTPGVISLVSKRV